jgi:hypothetical protein
MVSPLVPIQFLFSKNAVYDISAMSILCNFPVTEKSIMPVYFHARMVMYNSILFDALFLSISLTKYMNDKSVIKCPYIVLLRHPVSKKPYFVFFSGKIKGIWCKWHECIFNEGRLCIFVSRDSAELYPYPCYKQCQKCLNTNWFRFLNSCCCMSMVSWKPDGNDFEDATLQSWSTLHNIFETPYILHNPEM